MKKLLAMALALVMICSLFAVPAMADTVYNVNVTEKQPYLGTVTAPAFAAGGNTTITVTPEEGYYLYSATLDETPITGEFVNTDGVYTYTLDGTNVTADPNLVVSYGEYVAKEHITGGDLADSETALEIVTPYSGSHSVSYVTTEGNGDTSSVQATTGRVYLEGPTGKAPGDEYIASFDIKGASSVKVWPHNDKGILPDYGNAVNYTFGNLTASEWTRISVRVVLTEGGNRFVLAANVTAGAYIDNVSITSMVEGDEAKASVYYNVNVTEKQPECGTVTAPAFEEGTGTTITVTPEEGYYLYSATLDGAPVTFTKNGGVYTYALDGTNVTADPNLAVSYGEYDVTEYITGGDLADSETALEIVTPYSGSHSVAYVTTEGNGDTSSVQATTGRVYLEGPTGKAPGDEYIASFDVKGSASVKVWPHSDKGILPDYGNVVNYTFSNLTASEWTRISVRVVLTEGGNRFVLAANVTAGAYIDNVSITTVAEGGEVPTYYDINVTETNDFGTVTAPARVAEGETAEIKVAPDFGYYLASATLNGTDVTGSFVKTYAEDLNAGEVYTYTLANADAASSFAITYGQYYKTEYVTGGDLADSETALEIVTPYSGSYTVSHVTNEGNGDTNSVQISRRAYLEGPTGKAPGDEYIATFDIKGATSVKVWPHNDKGTLPAYENAVNHTFSGLTATEWTRISVRVVLTEGGNRFVLAVEAAGAYIDNVSIATLSKEAPLPPAPTTATVTISGDNAVTSVANGTVAIGGTTTFTVAPMLGYYIESITIGGEDFDGFNAYEKDTYTIEEINEDTEIVVTTAAVTSRGDNVATLADVFAEAGTAVTFGKVLDTTDATSWGIELTQDGEGVTPYHGGSYLYKAEATNANGQYAIEFVGLAAGEYTVRSYVYVNGTPTFGAPVTFVVR